MIGAAPRFVRRIVWLTIACVEETPVSVMKRLAENPRPPTLFQPSVPVFSVGFDAESDWGNIVSRVSPPSRKYHVPRN